MTVIHLRAGRVSLVLDAQGGAVEPLPHGSASAGEQEALAEVGLPMPVLRPEQALLPHLTSP